MYDYERGTKKMKMFFLLFVTRLCNVVWDDDNDEDLCTLAFPILFDLVVVPRVKSCWW